MQTYTGWQYLLIDAANQFGLDKLLFEERIQWATDNLDKLELLSDSRDAWKEQPLYLAAVMAIRKAQAGKPSGHMVGLDACCSGIQVMSAMTGCIAGATNTGMVNPNERADAYSKLHTVMISILDKQAGIIGSALNISRDDAKSALMKGFYGSKKVPKDLFGEDTPEINAFYAAAVEIAPGPWELLQDLLGSWNPWALVHAWKMPDGYDARVKVLQKREARIEVDELNHASFTYEFYENKGSEEGLSNAANVTHSMDAWVLRNMHRRCNFDWVSSDHAEVCMEAELIQREAGYTPTPEEQAEFTNPKIQYYIEQFNRSTLADPVILPYLDQANVSCLSTEHLEKLSVIAKSMLKHKPFELVTVHDEFKAHPNNLNHVRQHYVDIMAEIAESYVLDDLLSQVYGSKGTFQKLSTNLGALIRGSNYALS